MTDHCCSDMADDLNRICDQHPRRDDCPDALIAQLRGGYGIIIHDGGSAISEIGFCPWCGARLPPIDDLDLSDYPYAQE